MMRLTGRARTIRKNCFTVVFLSCLCLTLPPDASAQQPKPFSSPEEAAQLLAKCGPRECSDLTKPLGLTFPLAPACDVTVQTGPFEMNANDAILTVDCEGDFALLFLKEAQKGRWFHVNSVSFPQGDTFGDLKTRALNIYSQDTKDLVVEHLIGDHGTGYLEEYFVILRVVGGQLRAVLQTMEHYVRSGWPGVADVDEQSTFTFDAPTEKAPGDVVERLVIKTDKIPRIVLQRGISWDSASNMYAPDGWDTIKIASWPR